MDLSSPILADVLESAAQPQEIVPDLRERFDLVLEAVESSEGWVTNRVVPGKVILGELGDIEAGIQQMIRLRPLETQEVHLPSGRSLRVPTMDETLSVKAFLIVRRNQTRDYLDVVALVERMGLEAAAHVLTAIDDDYADQHGGGEGVASQVARQLADPRPKDRSTTRELHRYKRFDARWHDWATVVAHYRELADRMLDVGDTGP